MATLSRPASRVEHTFAWDSRRWNRYEPRDDDIVIATYPKSGTTWTQRLVDMLVFQSAEPRDLMALSPWLDCRMFALPEDDLATLAAQTHRRFIKSHMPFDLLPLYQEVKYIHVARDGRDACMSFHNHILAMTAAGRERSVQIMARDGLGIVPPAPTPGDPREFFLQWIADAEGEASAPAVHGSYFAFEKSYWDERNRANLLMVHYNDLKADLAGEMGRISRFLGIDTPPALLAELARAGEFAAMKRQGDQLLPRVTGNFDGGTQRFLFKGTNGRWREILTEADIARFEAALRKSVSASCAAWLERGRLPAGEPRDLPD